MRLHVLFHVGLLGEGSATDDALERLLSSVTADRKHSELSRDFNCEAHKNNLSLSLSLFTAADSPPNVLLQVKVFGKDLVTVAALQLGPFSFQLLC